MFQMLARHVKTSVPNLIDSFRSLTGKWRTHPILRYLKGAKTLLFLRVMHLSIDSPGYLSPGIPRGIWPVCFTYTLTQAGWRIWQWGRFWGDHEAHWLSSVCRCTVIFGCFPNWFNRPSHSNIQDVPCPRVGLFDHFLSLRGGVFG